MTNPDGNMIVMAVYFSNASTSLAGHLARKITRAEEQGAST
jgi:hypothetical protein